MECPKCKNPLSNKSASVCEWCGYQLPIPQEPLVNRIKRLLFICVEKVRANKKKYYRIALLGFGFVAVVIALTYFINKTSAPISSENKELTKEPEAPKIKIITPSSWQEKAAFDYLTNVRNQIINNNNDSFEKLALKYSQDTLSAGHRGKRVNNGQIGGEFDSTAKLIDVNKVSEIFEIKDGNGKVYRYGFMKLLEKGNGFYKVQYIVRNINLEVGQYYQGGIICYLDENAEHGLVLAQKNLGWHPWIIAKAKCEDLEFGGFNDWRLPSKADINLLDPSIYKLDVSATGFWSSLEYEGYSSSPQAVMYLSNLSGFATNKSEPGKALAFRTF
jgi:hypothetical protein